MTRIRNKILSIITAGLILSALMASWSSAQEESADMSRFRFSGDGKITIYGTGTKKSFSGVYRRGSDNYDINAISRICQVFGAAYNPSRMGISLRLIEFLDYLEDRLNQGAVITIISGYRRPEYNTTLRTKGLLAAKASLHQYGMAADIRIKGVKAITLWNYIRNLNFGGAGYYHGGSVHVDTGPARSWDETTSGVGKGISDNNKLISMITDFDVYQPGMTVTLRYIFMTAFPIRVAPDFALIRLNDSDEAERYQEFTPVFTASRTENRMEFKTIDEMNHITWKLPADLPHGRYRIEAGFRDNPWPEMPGMVRTPEFEVRSH